MNAVLLIVPIAAAWGALLGIAYLTRFTLRMSRRRSVIAIVGGYLALSVMALAWLGLTRSGGLGVFGMLLPLAAAIALGRLA